MYDAFLGPLESGEYSHAGHKYKIKPAIWLFAGTESPGSSHKSHGTQKSDKGSDFESRLTEKPVFLNHGGGDNAFDTGESKEVIVERCKVEQVYVGVSAIRSEFPDVNRVSRKVLWAFRLLPPDLGYRGIRRFVRSFQYVQYSRVISANLPNDWALTHGIGRDLQSKFEDEKEDCVPIRSRP